MSRSTYVAAGALVLALLSGLTMALPIAIAQSTVVVSMPNGAGLPAGAPGYAPATVTIVIGLNNTVTWTNNDTSHHTVTPGNMPAGATWSVGSGDMAPNAAYSFTFTVPGTYTYTCAYHNWMAGTVVVKAGTTTTPEFPAASLAVIFFAVMAAIMLAAPRLRPGRMGSPAP